MIYVVSGSRLGYLDYQSWGGGGGEHQKTKPLLQKATTFQANFNSEMETHPLKPILRKKIPKKYSLRFHLGKLKTIL